MRLVLFTAHFPFGKSEAFLEDELPIAAQYFDEITIVTTEKSNFQTNRALPKQVRIVTPRKDHSFSIRAAITMPLRKRFWRELRFAVSDRGLRSLLPILLQLLSAESIFFYLKKSMPQWNQSALFYSYWCSETAAFLALYRKQLDGRCISRAHGVDCFYDRGYIAYRREQLAALDCVYPISKAGKADLLSHFPTAKNVQVAYLGVHKLSDCLNPWQMQPVKTIVTCSNVIALKRLDLLIDALCLLSIPIRWIHFGDGELMPAMQERATDLNATWMGRVEKSEILRFYEQNSVDLFVNVSDFEGIPVSVMEAMSYGIPIVAKNVGGTCELVDSKCGILLDQNADAKAIAAAIETIFNLPPERNRQMRTAAFEKYQSAFCAETNFHRFYSNF